MPCKTLLHSAKSIPTPFNWQIRIIVKKIWQMTFAIHQLLHLPNLDIFYEVKTNFLSELSPPGITPPPPRHQ